jgi:hypothetical protein
MGTQFIQSILLRPNRLKRERFFHPKIKRAPPIWMWLMNRKNTHKMWTFVYSTFCNQWKCLLFNSNRIEPRFQMIPSSSSSSTFSRCADSHRFILHSVLFNSVRLHRVFHYKLGVSWLWYGA